MIQFKGFKPQAMQRIAGTLGYQGDMEGFKDYLDQNPDKMQQMGMYQQKALEMVNGGMVQYLANGGSPSSSVDPATGAAVDPVTGIPITSAEQMSEDQTVQPAAPQPTAPEPAPQPETTPVTQFDPRDAISDPAIQPFTPTQPDLSTTFKPMTKDEILVERYGWTMGADGIATPPTTQQPTEPLPREDTIERGIPSQPPEPIGRRPAPTDPLPDDFDPEPLPDYDPASGPPEPTSFINPVTGEPEVDINLSGRTWGDLTWAAHSDKGINMLLQSGKLPADPSTYEVSGGRENWIFTFPNGAKTVVNRARQSNAEATLKSEIVPVINKLKETPTYKQFQKEEDIYRDYLGKGTTEDVIRDLENIETEYGKANDSVQQQQIELERLKKLAEDNPDNPYYTDLVNNKVEELADSMERVNDLQPAYISARRTVKDITKSRFEDPSEFITEELGTKAVAAKTEMTDEQDIAEGTGRLTSVGQGTTTRADAFDADRADTARAFGMRPDKVTDTAEEKLKTLDAQTQEDLTREVEAQTGTIRPEGIADEAIKIGLDRIERAVNPTDLEVTKNQLAEVKGKELKSIEANISISDRLKKIVAQTSTVDPKELPPPAKISDSIMRSVQSLKETDPSLSEETTNYIAAKMEAFTVDAGTLAVAMQGEVRAQATVQGQLSSLMKSFDNGTPAWAAGAIRAANQAMLSRGMGASSMAAEAIVQAAMESALPIAQQDAQIFAAMDMANLENRQKVSLTNAAAQQGLSLQNLSNEQQMNLQNSVQSFDLQKVNLSNRQSVELANAQIRTSLQGKVLDNTQQSNIITAARYAEQANLNLNNKQQAVLQDNVGELQTNLADASARQQSYITSANLAQALQGQVLTNDQQVAIGNAARYSDAANLNFTSDQQEVLHNSSLMQTIGLAELNATQATTLQNAANFASMDMAELTNQQQAQVLNAQNFLQLDLANLSNEQQVAIFKAQAIQQTLLSDQASVNASRQFNATTQTQVDQFNVNLKTQVEQFNQAQKTAISQFNAGQADAMEQFNVSQSNAADQFNAQNELVIAQSNATWRREVAAAETAAQNRMNEINAKAALDMQAKAYDNMWQHYGDQMDNAYKSYENEEDRASAYAIAQLESDTDLAQQEAALDASASASLGGLAATLLTGDLSSGILGGIF